MHCTGIRGNGLGATWGSKDANGLIYGTRAQYGPFLVAKETV